MGPFPATGRQVRTDFISIVRVEDGRIAEMWVEWENLGLLAQLGLEPGGS